MNETSTKHKPLRKDYVLWLVVVSGFCLRLVYSFYARVEPWSDSEAYNQMAKNILDGVGWHSRGLSAISPGYPGFLAGVYSIQRKIEAVFVANAFLGGADIVLVSILARRIWNNRNVILGSACLVAFYPDLVIYSGILASENLVIPLILLLFLGLIEARQRQALGGWALAGAILGVTVLVRGMLLGVVPFFMVWLSVDVYGKRWRSFLSAGGVFVLSMSAVIAPWTIRNWVVHREFVPITTELGLGLWGGNNEEANGEWMGDFLNRQKLPPGLTEVGKSSYQTRQALKFAVEYPLDVLVLMIKKFGLFWGIKMDGAYLYQDVIPPILALGLSSISQAGIIGFLFLGLFVTYPWSANSRLVLVFTLYMLCLTLVFYYLTRYRLMLYASWAPFVACGIQQARGFFSERRPWSSAQKALVGIYVFLLVNWGWIVWRYVGKIIVFAGQRGSP